ncbi:hypothetical protein P167DRAFT_362919 [Morchella conica CCBAS932]|uniref:Uncharacterized protein n=1 Tax=Morchella conica CCBAS932 TaxID=1392247 RepID=A0A3N4KCD7_9PEZI|nr:hypothetical protein P167DRAFT_362919 [Morchella conica CCBAS932]
MYFFLPGAQVNHAAQQLPRPIDALLDIANLSQIKKKNPVSVPPWPYRSFIPWIWEIISLLLQPDMIFPSAGNLGGRQRDGVGYLYINITGVETSNTSRNYRCRSDWVDIKPARNHIGLQFSVVGTSNLGEPTDYLDELQKDLHKNVSLDYHIVSPQFSTDKTSEDYWILMAKILLGSIVPEWRERRL